MTMPLHDFSTGRGAYNTLESETGPEFSPYNYDPRPSRDAFWKWMLFVLLAVGVSGALYCIVNADANSAVKSSSEYLAGPDHCTVPNYAQRRILSTEDEHKGGSQSRFGRGSWVWFAGSMLTGLGLGVGYMQALKSNAPLAAGLHVLVWIVGGSLVWFTSSQLVLTILCFVMGGFVGCFHWWTRARFAVYSRLLSTASKGLKQNPGTTFLGIVLWTVLVCAFLGALGVSFVAGRNGSVEWNAGEKRIPRTKVDPVTDEKYCVNMYVEEGEGPSDERLDCCKWSMEPLAVACMVFAWVTFAWLVTTILQLRLFTVAGTIAQWYYLPPLSSTKGVFSRSLKNALGPQFGTLAFGGLAQYLYFNFTLCVRIQQREGFTRYTIQGTRNVLNFCINVVQYFSRFATVWAAVTGGDSLLEAGRKAAALLDGNGLNWHSMWWHPPFAITSTSAGLGVAWGIASTLLASSGLLSVPKEYIPLLGFISALVIFLGFSFWCGLLLNAAETLYICYAVDKTNNRVVREDVHSIFDEMPVDVGFAQGQQPVHNEQQLAHQPIIHVTRA